MARILTSPLLPAPPSPSSPSAPHAAACARHNESATPPPSSATAFSPHPEPPQTAPAQTPEPAPSRLPTSHETPAKPPPQCPHPSPSATPSSAPNSKLVARPLVARRWTTPHAPHTSATDPTTARYAATETPPKANPQAAQTSPHRSIPQPSAQHPPPPTPAHATPPAAPAQPRQAFPATKAPPRDSQLVSRNSKPTPRPSFYPASQPFPRAKLPHNIAHISMLRLDRQIHRPHLVGTHLARQSLHSHANLRPSPQ